MIAIAKEKKTDPAPSWHQGFLKLLPAIHRHASIAFRDLNPDARAEAIQEVTCNALQAYRRLVELNKTDIAYASVLARYGVAQTKAGRKVGGHLNGNDVSSSYAQRAKRITVERLDRFNQRRGVWKEVLVEDKTATPADIAACRIDFGNWLQTLTNKQRRVADVMAAGETTKAAAKAFSVTPGRISQIRRELKQAWEAFIGDPATSPTK